MNQEITLSRNVIKFLYEHIRTFENSITGDCLQKIKQNKIALDEKQILLNNYKDELEGLPSCDKSNEFKKFIQELIYRQLMTFQSDKIINEEISLCKITNDKIYIDPVLSNDELKKVQDDNPEIEFHDAKSFLNPKLMHRFKIVPYKAKFLNETYNFNEIFLPYLINSEFIEIIDPYLPNKTASDNLFSLIEKLNQNIIIKLNCYNKKDFTGNKKNKKRKENIYDGFMKRIEVYKKRFNIKIVALETTRHIERYILTNRFKIYVPGGLDFMSEGRVNVAKKDIKELIVDFRN